jgi:formylglycine-generating enzyme required for sulfatase activity
MKQILLLFFMLIIQLAHAQFDTRPKTKPQQQVLPQTGTLKIVSNVAGTIKIDGESKGNIEENGVRKFELRAGDYIIQLFPSDGSIVLNEEISLVAGQTETVKLEVKKEQIQEKPAPQPQLNSGPNIDMIFVQGGTFTMGCTAEQGTDCEGDEKPAHTVTLSSFSIGKYEVTQAQWEAVMGSNPSYFKGCANCPVEYVSWNDVQDFISKLNAKTGRTYRLPTEAEWEYAARGGSSSRGYKYAGSNEIAAVAWYKENSNDKTHPFGQKSPNELGIYDMTGNVWEWCSDWYGESYYNSSPGNNPQGPNSGSGRVLRGGSWFNSPQRCRVSRRNDRNPDYGDFSLGFRLVLVP